MNNALDNVIMTEVVRSEWTFTGFCRNCDTRVTEETSEYYWNAMHTYIENAWHEHLPVIKLIGSIHLDRCENINLIDSELNHRNFKLVVCNNCGDTIGRNRYKGVNFYYTKIKTVSGYIEG